MHCWECCETAEAVGEGSQRRRSLAIKARLPPFPSIPPRCGPIDQSCQNGQSWGCPKKVNRNLLNPWGHAQYRSLRMFPPSFGCPLIHGSPQTEPEAPLPPVRGFILPARLLDAQGRYSFCCGARLTADAIGSGLIFASPSGEA